MTLDASFHNPDSPCPFQRGRVLGTRYGADVQVDVDWLVDTGAEITTVLHSVGTAFDALLAVGVSATPTTGGIGIQVVTGMTVEFSAHDPDGATRLIHAAGFIGIKSADTLNNLLGMEQLAEAGVSLNWTPSTRTGLILI